MLEGIYRAGIDGHVLDLERNQTVKRKTSLVGRKSAPIMAENA